MQYRFVFDNPQVHRHFEQAARQDAANARLSRAFRCYYNFVRPRLPAAFRRMMQARYRVPTTPDWYLPTEFFAGLTQSLPPDEPLCVIHPWPDRARFAFVLTHDVETAEGMRNITRIAEIEEDLGFRSSWNIVPHLYEIDHELLRELGERGFEIGVHGYNHDGKLFSSQHAFDKRLELIQQAAKQMSAVGFRAPMMHRNLSWLTTSRFAYDASHFDIDPFQPMPGGVGGIWPFIADELVVLPCTLPQDHTLFIVLGQTDCEVWKRKLDFVAARSGMALMLTHPDYLLTPRSSDVYREFLAHVKERGDYWHALPRDVASWWRDRDASQFDPREATLAGLATGRAHVSIVSQDDARFQLLPHVASASNRA